MNLLYLFRYTTTTITTTIIYIHDLTEIFKHAKFIMQTVQTLL